MYKKTRTFVKEKSHHKGHYKVTKTVGKGKPRFKSDSWFRSAIYVTKHKITSRWKTIIKRRTGVNVK